MDVLARYKALEQFSKEDARLQFLRILRSLPYGAHCPLTRAIPMPLKSAGPPAMKFVCICWFIMWYRKKWWRPPCHVMCTAAWSVDMPKHARQRQK